MYDLSIESNTHTYFYLVHRLYPENQRQGDHKE